MNHRFIIAGGGTGGHIFPALAIAEAIRSMAPETSFQFVGANGKMEMEKVPQAGFAIEGLDIVGFDRKHFWKNITLPFKLFRSFIQVKQIFQAFRPTAVIGVGGYSSFPVLRYAQSKGIPTFLHESNSFAGKSNQWLGKRATRIFTGMPSMESFFPSDKITFTGNPVRASITQNIQDRTQALQAFGLDPHKKTVLVIGGSLGARSINQAIQQGYDRILQAGLQLIWQTGKSGSDLPALSMDAAGSVHRTVFIKEMELAYAAADIVVARAGAMSIAELQVVAKPVILVPFPLAAEDHQRVNAEQLVQTGAALMVVDADAKTQLIDKILELSSDEARCQQMRTKIGGMGIKDAAVRVATEILRTLNNKEPLTKG